jgi:hypothetical protein
MYRRERPVNPQFDAAERLFRRCVDLEIREGRVFADQIPFYPAMSVNRSRYSYPEDVIYPEIWRCGVFSFRVDAIPDRYAIAGAGYEWLPSHEPEDDNYAHSEVHTLKNGVFSQTKLSLTVKKHFRALLAKSSTVEIEPGSACPDPEDRRGFPDADEGNA